MLSGISVHVVKMRMLATTLLLCTLVLMHDVSSQGYFGKIWNKVFKWSFYPVRAARFTIFARYGVPANAYWLHMDWALGAVSITLSSFYQTRNALLNLNILQLIFHWYVHIIKLSVLIFELILRNKF